VTEEWALSVSLDAYPDFLDDEGIQQL